MSQRKKVVVVGMGKRARNVLIPALLRLEESFTIQAILARTPREELVAGRNFTVRTELSDEEWGLADAVVLAVPKEQVRAVLSQIPKATRKNITLLLDTPVIPLRRLGILRTLAGFKRALVSEDSIGLPFWESVRECIDSGTIGKPRMLQFLHSGYRYHALAAAKRSSNAHAFWSIRLRKTGNGNDGERFVHLPRSCQAYILEPRDYSIGRTLVMGTKGSIGDYPLASPNHHEVPGTLGNEAMEAAKIEGFIRILASIDEKDSPYHYAPIDGVYDYLACTLSERTGWFLDIPLPVGQSVVKIGINLLSYLSPR